MSNFSDISDLETELSDAKNLTDVEEVRFSLNQMMRREDVSQDQKVELKKFRQKIYDRKKIIGAPQLLVKEPVLINTKFEKIMYFTLCGFLAICATWFLWRQSIDLYASSGFFEPLEASVGAILTMIGFAALHAVSRSKLAFILCIYSSGYELAFIVSATLKNEDVVQNTHIEKNVKIVWLKDQVERASATYQNAKQKFEDPESKVFQNNWFKAKYLDPAWREYSEVQNNLEAKKDELLGNQYFDRHIAWLKVLYRLSLVFLAMLAVHLLLRQKFSVA